MKLANLDGRAAVITDQGAIDVAAASGGTFGPDLATVYERWDEFVAAAPAFDRSTAEPYADETLGAPSPTPRQVFAIGLNYRSHAEESDMEIPAEPATFTKFPACIAGPYAAVEVVAPTVDWEVEVVAVVGTRADRVDVADAWSHVAGLTVGQDFSERTMQFAAGGQFSLGKSYRNFGPTGPWLVTPDEFADPDDVALRCTIDDETVQDARSSDLIFDIPQLIARLSAVVPLLPGDLVFTGTPSGVGATARPARFLQPGDVVESSVEGIGSIRNRMVATG